jgi:hypothetical protein
MAYVRKTSLRGLGSEWVSVAIGDSHFAAVNPGVA